MPLDAGLPVRAEAGPGTEWNVLVDKDGKRVSGPYGLGLFWARRPIAIKFAGHAILDPAHPRPPSDIQAREQKDRRSLWQAVFDLSQTRPGRDSLKAIAESHCAVVFSAETTMPSVNHTKQRIILPSGNPVSSLQLSLAHEGRHLRDKADGFDWRTSMTLKEALSVCFLLEALARGREAEHAAHCEAGISGYPDLRYRPPFIMQSLDNSCAVESLGNAARDGLPLLKAGTDGEFAKNVSSVFYSCMGSRIHYAKTVLGEFSEALDRRLAAGRQRQDPKNAAMADYMTCEGATLGFASKLPFADRGFLALIEATMPVACRAATRALQEKIAETVKGTALEPDSKIHFDDQCLNAATALPTNQLLRQLISIPRAGHAEYELLPTGS